mgnify:CR=1 FL=1
MTEQYRNGRHSESHRPARRRFLQTLVGTSATLAAAPLWASVHPATERSLAFTNLHTGESLQAIIWADGQYVDDELVAVKGAYHVISGYRSPKTNAKLHSKSSGVAKKSLHMQGKAIDIRLPGCELKHLRQAALDLKAGGVGYYAKSNFIHLDTGRVRRW